MRGREELSGVEVVTGKDGKGKERKREREEEEELVEKKKERGGVWCGYYPRSTKISH